MLTCRGTLSCHARGNSSWQDVSPLKKMTPNICVKLSTRRISASNGYDLSYQAKIVHSFPEIEIRKSTFSSFHTTQRFELDPFVFSNFHARPNPHIAQCQLCPRFAEAKSLCGKLHRRCHSCSQHDSKFQRPLECQSRYLLLERTLPSFENHRILYLPVTSSLRLFIVFLGFQSKPKYCLY